MSNRVVIITGASSGIGLATANEFLKLGCTVYGLSRKPYDSGSVIHISADVSSFESVSAAIETVYSNEGRIDVLICNAGFGISGAAEFTTEAMAHSQFDVNFFGTVNCTRAVLPIMRTQNFGSIIAVSSVAAVLSIPFQSFYSASKAAINAYMLALANEVKIYSIAVASLMPGDIKTGFTDARKKNDLGENVYAAQNKSIATMEKGEQNGMSPILIAKALVKLSLKKRPKPLSTVGIQYKLFCLLQKLLPARLINYLVGKLYA